MCLRVIMHKTSKCLELTTILNSIIHQQAAKQSCICKPSLAVLTLLVIGLKWLISDERSSFPNCKWNDLTRDSSTSIPQSPETERESPVSSLACDTRVCVCVYVCVCVCVCGKEGHRAVCKEKASWGSPNSSVSNASGSRHVSPSASVLHSVLESVSPAVSSAMHHTGRPAEQALLSGLAGWRFGVWLSVGSRLLPGRLGLRSSRRAAVPTFRPGRPWALASGVLQPNLPVRRKLHGLRLRRVQVRLLRRQLRGTTGICAQKHLPVISVWKAKVHLIPQSRQNYHQPRLCDRDGHVCADEQWLDAPVLWHQHVRSVRLDSLLRVPWRAARGSRERVGRHWLCPRIGRVSALASGLPAVLGARDPEADRWL